jgi:Tol biopolymer transport system component
VSRLRLLDLETGLDVAVGQTGALYGEGGGMFSPDGTLIAYRGGDEGGFRLYVVPVDGSAEPRALTGLTPGDAWHEFSPDGTKVMLNLFESETTQVIDAETGEADLLPDQIRDPGTWQRLAP